MCVYMRLWVCVVKCVHVLMCLQVYVCVQINFVGLCS